MKASELRIGNWFLCNLFAVDELYQVETIETSGVKYGAEDGYVIPFGDVEPIPLTSKILEEVGFKILTAGDNNTTFDHWEINGFNLLWEHDEGFCINFDNDLEVKHVHQLQNIYFSLTGEELPIIQKMLEEPPRPWNPLGGPMARIL